MDLSSSQWIQLNIAAVLAVIAFMFVYSASTRLIVTSLILIIPFQIVTSRYGSLNIYLVYLIAFVFLLRGQIRELPLIGLVGAIALAYGISLSQAPAVTRGDHLLYLFFVGSNFLVFYVVYNHFRMYPDVRRFLHLFIILNALVIVYSTVQLIVGNNPNSPLFGEEIGLRPPREDGRLTGPFGTVGLTAEFTVVSVFVIGFMLMSMQLTTKAKILLILLLLGNFAIMIATGNRGGIFAMIAAGLFFLYLFRAEFGARGIVIALSGAVFVFAMAAAVVINYSDFNMLFDRLEETEVEGGIPDSRSKTWPATWARIQERPLAGGGPQLRLSESTYNRPGSPPSYSMPHNLYLFLVDTVGVIGFLAYMAFFVSLFFKFSLSKEPRKSDPLIAGLPRLAMVLMAVFFIDQIKVEFLRSSATEYQHFVFMLWGALLALVSGQGNRTRAPQY